MEGSVLDSDHEAAPDSWEVVDMDASMRRLMIASSSSKKKDADNLLNSGSFGDRNQIKLGDGVDSVSDLAAVTKGSGVALGDLISSVDEFLREALQNPRERLSVLRMEQEIEKFIHDPNRQQMESALLPTSYLRLAAHRVAQHYCLPSMVLLDNTLPDGSGSRIIVQKTTECKIPLIRLADIPVNLPSEGSSVVKVAIKQRPQKGSQTSGSNLHLSRTSSLKSVEERKEEYNRARARIFSSNSFNGGTSGKAECVAKAQESFQQVSRVLKVEQKPSNEVPDLHVVRSGLHDSVSGSSRPARDRTEKDTLSRSKSSSKVAIFRDRETDRKDPDYNRSYDRYMQRFDPGFGFNGIAYGIQPMYTSAVTYNSEFPQLGSIQVSPMSNEPHPISLPQHMAGHWSAPSSPAGMAYVPTETMMVPFAHNHVGGRSNSAMFLASAQYPAQHPGFHYILPHEHVHQSFVQSLQQQPDMGFGLARPR